VHGGTLNVNSQQTGPFGNLLVKAGLRNDGTVNIYQGTLAAFNSTSNDGQYTLAYGSALDLLGVNGATNYLNPNSVISGLGEAYFGAGSHIQIAGTVNVGNVTDKSSVVDDTANSTLIVNGAYNWYGGTWAGSGTTQIGTNLNSSASLTLAVTGSGYSLKRHLVNYGTITWKAPADITVSSGGSIDNMGGSLFDIQVGQKILSGLPAGNFTNAGIVRMSAGGAAEIHVPFQPLLGGRIEVKTNNTLHFTGPVSVIGSVQVDTGATLAFDGGMEQDGGAVTDNGTITDAGTYNLTAGTLEVSGGMMGASGLVSVAGAFNQTGGTVQASGAMMGTGGAISVGGAYNESGGTVDANGGSITVTGAYNETGGSLTLESGTVAANGMQVAAGAVLSGYGTINSAVSNAGEIDAAVYQTLTVGGAYTQTAGVTNVYGTLHVSGALDELGGVVNMASSNLYVLSHYTIESGAVLSGAGTLTADVTNDGLIQVGGPNSTLALMFQSDGSNSVYGNFTQTDTGELDMNLANPTMNGSLVSASGLFTLGGTLHVHLINGYTPQPGDTFNLISGMTSGDFAVLDLPGGAWNVQHQQGGIYLTAQ
jgi:hypothetical protein